MQQNWIYNERFAPGVDHNDLEVAKEYDQRHSSMYDPVATAIEVLDKLKLYTTESLIDMGAGTGTLSIEAAKRCVTVYAVDISKAMLDQAVKKAKKAAINNIRFIQASFLTYEHAKNSADAMVSRGALHHLPDFWKGIALQRFFDFLRPGGRLFLDDAIYSFDIREYQEAYNKSIKTLEKSVSPDFFEQITTDLSSEFMTFAWIIEGLLEKAGFDIEEKAYPTNWNAQYLCRKPG